MIEKRGKWKPATRIRFRKSAETYVLFGEGLKMSVAREEEEDTVGSFVY